MLIFISFKSHGQFLFKAKVHDENDKAIKSAYIVESFNNKIAVTDSNGYFEILISSPSTYIIVSHISYKTKKVSNLYNVSSIQLTKSIQELDEIVIKINENKGLEIIEKIRSNLQFNYNYKNVLYSVTYKSSAEDWYPNKYDNSFQLNYQLYSNEDEKVGMKITKYRLKSNINGNEISSNFVTKFHFSEMLVRYWTTHRLKKSKNILIKENPNFIIKKNSIKKFESPVINQSIYNKDTIYIVKLKNKKTGKLLSLFVNKNDYGIYKMEYEDFITIYEKIGDTYFPKYHGNNIYSYNFYGMERKSLDYKWESNYSLKTDFSLYKTNWNDSYWDKLK